MAAAMAVVGAASANAAPVGSFHICQGGSCINVLGNNFGPTTVGDYTVAGSGAFFNTSAFSETSNTNIQIYRTTPGTGIATALDVWYTVTDYTLPTGPQFVMSSSGTATKTGTSSDSVSYSVWYSSNNSVGFPTGVLGGSGACTPSASVTILTTSCGGGTVINAVGAGSALYALISKTTFNIGINNASLFSSTGQADITAVPEPGSMVLLGTGLVGMATMLRRRYAKK